MSWSSIGTSLVLGTVERGLEYSSSVGDIERVFDGDVSPVGNFDGTDELTYGDEGGVVLVVDLEFSVKFQRCKWTK